VRRFRTEATFLESQIGDAARTTLSTTLIIAINQNTTARSYMPDTQYTVVIFVIESKILICYTKKQNH